MTGRTDMQSGDSPYSIGVDSGMPLCQRCLLEQGKAHEAIVAMMPMTTSGKSEGPLGCRGLGLHGDLGDCPIFSPVETLGYCHGLPTPQRKVEPNSLGRSMQQTALTGSRKAAYDAKTQLGTGLGKSRRPGF